MILASVRSLAVVSVFAVLTAGWLFALCLYMDRRSVRSTSSDLPAGGVERRDTSDREEQA